MTFYMCGYNSLEIFWILKLVEATSFGNQRVIFFRLYIPSKPGTGFPLASFGGFNWFPSPTQVAAIAWAVSVCHQLSKTGTLNWSWAHNRVSWSQCSPATKRYFKLKQQRIYIFYTEMIFYVIKKLQNQVGNVIFL